ncbi:MAG: hypothetical protein KGH59_02550 [Candidatus Micrarchaeota archaeon]|nr:hypothetical protein [Candidatus Micrarchaeota archaeon]MDE1804637.1 hypothetical protein [Candidatus Micrarchaeota archaeon]
MVRRKREYIRAQHALELALRNDEATTELYRKLVRVESLPTYQECYDLVRRMKSNVRAKMTARLLMASDVYTIVTNELVDQIAQTLLGLKPKRALEICAGSGKLSYWLNKRGVEIVPTDSGEGIKSDYCEMLDHLQALNKYRPDVVLAAFPPSETPQIPLDVLSREHVRHFVVIGKAALFERRYGAEISRLAAIAPLELPLFPRSADGKHREVDRGITLSAIYTKRDSV